MNTAYKLHGIHRHYEWGGQSFIPQLMHIDNAIGKPFAEYWMGAHPSAPAMVETREGAIALDKMILENTVQFLGAKTADRFGSLPYLFKILSHCVAAGCDHGGTFYWSASHTFWLGLVGHWRR